MTQIFVQFLLVWFVLFLIWMSWLFNNRAKQILDLLRHIEILLEKLHGAVFVGEVDGITAACNEGVVGRERKK